MISARSRFWLVPILASRSESTYSSSELLIEKASNRCTSFGAAQIEDTTGCGNGACLLRFMSSDLDPFGLDG
jgi:hypothetical protein